MLTLATLARQGEPQYLIVSSYGRWPYIGLHCHCKEMEVLSKYFIMGLRKSKPSDNMNDMLLKVHA